MERTCSWSRRGDNELTDQPRDYHQAPALVSAWGDDIMRAGRERERTRRDSSTRRASAVIRESEENP